MDGSYELGNGKNGKGNGKNGKAVHYDGTPVADFPKKKKARSALNWSDGPQVYVEKLLDVDPGEI
jgi:hypothetical protein